MMVEGSLCKARCHMAVWDLKKEWRKKETRRENEDTEKARPRLQGSTG